MMKENNFNFQDPEMIHFLSDSLQQFSMCITKTIDKNAVKAIQLAAEEALRAYQQTSEMLIDSIDLEALNGVVNSFSQVRETIVSLYPKGYFENLRIDSEPFSCMEDRLYGTWDQVEAVVSAESRECLYLEQAPLLTKIKQKVSLSFSDEISAFGLFIAILAFLLDLAPDSQLEKMQQQNSVIISNQRQMIEIMEKHNQQIEKSVWLLQGSIDALHQEIQAFCEQCENITDFSDLNGEPQQQNALDQKSDTQKDE